MRQKDQTGLRIGFERGATEAFVMAILAFVLIYLFQSTIVVAVLYGLQLFAESGLSSYRRHYLTGVGLWFWNALMTGAMWAVGFDGYPLLGLTLGGVIGTVCGSAIGWHIRSIQPKPAAGK